MSQDNRPALARFNYRIGTYGSIREFLFHQLDKTPALQTWTHRAPDDPAVALMEGVSILGDILTLYQETYANEAFLRTARWRESIAELVRWLGYRLSPGVGGRAVFAFEIRKQEPVTVPARFPLKATLEHFEKPADFETVEETVAYPGLNRFSLYRPLEDGDITPATTEFYITAPQQLRYPVALKAGERLLMGEPSASWPNQPLDLANAEIVIVDSVRQLHSTQIVAIKGNLMRLSNVAQLAAYRIGRTFHHFGHNSPDQIVDPSEPVTSSSTVTNGSNGSTTETSSTIPYLDVPSSRVIRSASGAFSDPAISRSIALGEFPLDLELNDLPAKRPIIVQARFAHPFSGSAQQMFDPLPAPHTLVRTIDDVRTTTLSWGAITGTVSEIIVAEPIADSIGDGDATARAAANAAWLAAEAAVVAATTALENARAAARTAQAAADTAATAAARADADAAAAAARADAAAADAATMAVAAQVAAAALKDDATDAATQAALTAATDAFNVAEDAKAKTATAAADAAIAKTDTDTAKGKVDDAGTAVIALNAYLTPPSPGSGHLADPILDGFVGGVDGTVVAAVGAANTAQRSVATAKTATDTAKVAVDLSRERASTAKDRASDAREAARVDARAKQRSIDADAALATAQAKASNAANAATAAKTTATNAQNTAATAAATAATIADRVTPAEAALAAAKREAVSKRIVKDTRMYIKDALFHEVTSPLVTIRRAQQETTVARGHTLNFEGIADEVKALANRRIMLERPGEDAAVLSVLSVPSQFDPATIGLRQLYPIDLSTDVAYDDFPNQGAIVTVFGNLVDATQGKSLAETPIGSGDANQIFQTFKLPKAPLTYHLVPGHTPPETPQLNVYVDGREWQQVDSLFAHKKNEPLYIVREDPAGNSWVQFGDGKTGARLTAGVNNVSAVYRIGAGAYGSLKADTKVVASATLKNLDKIWMPADATGGAPPESGDNARRAGPGRIQSLGRIVSLRDFEADAAAIPGVASAAASWQLSGDIPGVEVTVLMETGRADELTAVSETLNADNMERGAGREPVYVSGGKRMYVAVAVAYALKPTYRADRVEAAIRRALGVNYGRATREEDQTGLFSLERRRFGGPEYASSIAGRVQNVEGVLWARTDALTTLTDADDPAAIAPPSLTILEPVVACDSRHLLSLYDSHLTLTAVRENGVPR